MQTASSETESKSLGLSICVHHYTVRAPCPKGQGTSRVGYKMRHAAFQAHRDCIKYSLHRWALSVAIIFGLRATSFVHVVSYGKRESNAIAPLCIEACRSF